MPPRMEVSTVVAPAPAFGGTGRGDDAPQFTASSRMLRTAPFSRVGSGAGIVLRAHAGRSGKAAVETRTTREHDGCEDNKNAGDMLHTARLDD